ncbi:MAG: hypothetical protein H3C36_02865 [Chitinophagaceae bacterium]|nr:hypothetical protein [Chitinophagaceae bacterium]
MKPKINIAFNNGVLGAVSPLDTGVFAFMASAVAVPDTFALGKAYMVKSMKDVAALGITASIDNYKLFKALSEFFAEAGEGQEAWIYGMSKATAVSEWFTEVEGVSPAENLLNAAQGKIRGIFTVYNPTAPPDLGAEVMDPDVPVAAGLAQTLFEKYADAKYAPFFTVLEGYAFTGDKVELDSLLTQNFNSVGVLIGDTENRSGATSSNGAAVGVLAGRLAAYSTKVNPGKVRNGALKSQKMFVVDTAVELYDNEALNDKGYIAFTTHAGRTGYFFMDAPLACPVDDDYHYITHRRTINEAFRLTYDALLDFLLDEVPANADGTIQAIYAKTMESAVVRKISTSMPEDLSADQTDPKDVGVKCFVDPSQNIVSTSKVNVNVGIRPFGYNRWIDVMLGFELTND